MVPGPCGQQAVPEATLGLRRLLPSESSGRDSGSVEGTVGSGRFEESRGQRAEAHSLTCISQPDQEALGVEQVMPGGSGCPWSWEGLRGLMGMWDTGWRVDGAGCWEAGGHLHRPSRSPQSPALGPRSLCPQLLEASSSAGLMARDPPAKPAPWLPQLRLTEVWLCHHICGSASCLPPQVPVTGAPSV